MPSPFDDPQAKPLSVEECRRLLEWKDASDEEIKEFLGDLRSYLSRFLDEYFADEFPVDEML
ncbi:MAG: hypothetical protein V1876_03115 [Candidatus Peregrinibacteria bacterium]